MQKLKAPITIILLASVIFSLVPITESNAQGEMLAAGISCLVGGLLAPWLVDQALNLLQRLYNNLSQRIRNFLGWGVLSIIFPPDVPTDDSRNNTKEYIGDTIARCGAAMILERTSRSMIAGVRTSGRNGGPAFVRNWRRFKLDAQHRGENIFRSILGSTDICPYFSGDLRTIFQANNQPPAGRMGSSIRAGNLDDFKVRAGCTLPRGWSLRSYQNDFVGNGGWPALLRLNRPQNNFYGNLIMSLSEVSIQRAAEEDSDMSSVIAGLGFDSRRGTDEADSCFLTGATGRCVVYKDILTPGSYIQQSAAALVQQELAWITNVDELNELIANLTFRLMRRLLDLSGENRSAQVIRGRPPNEGPPDLDTIYPEEPITPAPECSDGLDNDGDSLYDYPSDPDCTSSSDNDESSGGGGGGGGACAGTGTARYASALRAAMDTVIASNPGGIADQPNTSTNTFIFFGYVRTELQNAGFQGTSNVLNGNGNPNSGDLMAVFLTGDTLMDRYDAIIALGSGTLIRNSTATQFTGQVPISSCTGSGGAFAVTVWSDINFSGTWESFTSGDTALVNNIIGDNNIESIQVPAGMSADLCDGIDFGPPCETFTADDLDLSNNTIGANTASSIRVPSGGGAGPSECSDGLDNDTDGLIDFPQDPGCLNSNDNDEVTYVVSLCRGANNGLPCEWFSADDPDLSDNPGNLPITSPVPVGDNQASSFVAGGITFGRLVVEFCLDPNFGRCIPITIGSDNDFSDSIPVPNDSISSIMVRQR